MILKKIYLTVSIFFLLLVLTNCKDEKAALRIPDQFEIYYMWTLDANQSAIEVKSSSDSITVSRDNSDKKYPVSRASRDSLFLVTMADIQDVELSLPDQLQYGTALIMVVKSAGKSYSVQYDRIMLQTTSNKKVKSIFRILSGIAVQDLY